jgi:hypothetical protein
MNTDALLTYGAPFLGAVLLSLGIAGGVIGGYSVIQQDLGLCGDPLIHVDTPEDTEALLQGSGDSPGPALERLAVSDLSDAEQAAFEEALESPRREGAVDGAFTHREAVVAGVVVTYEGEEYYATLASDNECLSADPLLFPLGIVGILLGIGGVLTPPLYRWYLRFERRQGETS